MIQSRVSTTSQVILILSALVFIFYFITVVARFNVYRFAVTGAIFEMISIPMLLLLFILPVLSLYGIIVIKENKIFPMVSLVLVILSVLMLYFFA